MNQSSNPSLAGRALAAVALMIGFYALAIGIAAALLYIPYAEVVYAGRIHIKLAIGCVVGGLAILWAILPRIDRFEAPGPKLDPVEQKELFRTLTQVARGTGQTMPSEVYIVSDVNAWVSQRGGVMGFGSRRVMGLGLPLLQTLRVSEFTAVIGHEFGHFHGGDTSLGPWIYKTRAAIGRTIQSLGDGVLHKPFLWYGNFFLRVTQAISRRQELAADQLAAAIAGPAALANGLIAVHRAAPAFDSYWRNEIVPLLNAGYRPPIADGFRQFVNIDSISSAMEKIADEELQHGEADIYDSHPPLRERLAALGQLEQRTAPADEPVAASLLRNTSRIERELLAVLGGAELAKSLKPLSWSAAGTTVFLPFWRERVSKNASVLADLTPESLSSLIGSMTGLVRKLDMDGVPPEERVDAAEDVIGCAIAVVLADRGWTPVAEPGREIEMTRDELVMRPFSVMRRLRTAELAAEGWQTELVAAGIAGAPLAQR
ncbi:MAG: M48 family metallopeptidase [Acidobacteria bacterium]|nr:M48 family metallopeptidase [Acidobacteriota bacterium]